MGTPENRAFPGRGGACRPVMTRTVNGPSMIPNHARSFSATAMLARSSRSALSSSARSSCTSTPGRSDSAAAMLANARRGAARAARHETLLSSAAVPGARAPGPQGAPKAHVCGWLGASPKFAVDGAPLILRRTGQGALRADLAFARGGGRGSDPRPWLLPSNARRPSSSRFTFLASRIASSSRASRSSAGSCRTLGYEVVAHGHATARRARGGGGARRGQAEGAR